MRCCFVRGMPAVHRRGGETGELGIGLSVLIYTPVQFQKTRGNYWYS